MRATRLLQSIAAAVLGCAASLACGQDILVGQVSSLTNPITALNAKGLSVGINVYFSHVNAQGGVGGRVVKLVNKDDQLTPGKMTELTREFIADKRVVALAAYQNTSGITELAKLNVVGEGGIAMVAPFQGDRSLVSAPNFYPFRSGYPDELAALVKEALFTQKTRVAVVSQTATFGPAMLKLVLEMSKKEGLDIVADIKVETAVADKLDASVSAAAQELIKSSPDAIMMLLGGRGGLALMKQIKNSPLQDTQLYLMSVVPAQEVFKAVGGKARGVIIAQAVPFPFAATLPLVAQYQKLMKQYAPEEPLSFSSLEGFVSAKITVEAIKRAGPNPTREKVLKALNSMGELDLGGVYVNYSPKERIGWGGVDLTIIGENGKLLR